MDPLKIPPDLSQPETDSESNDVITSYLSFKENQGGPAKGQVLHDYQGMRFVRDGSLFWLEIKDSPTQIWQSLHDFFYQLGFKISFERPELGIMQTNWQENLANKPGNWFLKFISKLYATNVMDSFRAHLEYDDAKQITRVFITHRGVREASSGEASNITIGSTKWVNRPADPSLEQEMLMRFMVFRGMGKKQARQVIAQTKAVTKATLTQTSTGYVLQYNDSFARVWRLVGIALDRMGVQIEDRNRSAGVYYLQLPDTFKLGDSSGFFSSAKKPSSYKYLLSVTDKGDNTLITVKARGEAGKDFAEVSKKILDEIKNNLQ